MKIHIRPDTPKEIHLAGVGDREFRLTAPYTVAYVRESDDGSSSVEREFTIRPRFFTDLGTVPWMFRWLVSVASAPQAFAVHDFLYRDTDVSRSECDAVMLAMMHYCSAPKSRVKRTLAHAAVRLGGWVARNSDGVEGA